jgi:hypothetical protein
MVSAFGSWLWGGSLHMAVTRWSIFSSGLGATAPPACHPPPKAAYFHSFLWPSGLLSCLLPIPDPVPLFPCPLLPPRSLSPFALLNVIVASSLGPSFFLKFYGLWNVSWIFGILGWNPLICETIPVISFWDYVTSCRMIFSSSIHLPAKFMIFSF